MKLFVCLFCLWWLPFSAFSAISTGPLRLEFGDGMTRPQNIVVDNKGNQVTYVAVKVKKITGINTPNRKEVLIAKPSEEGLFISPMKLILKPKQKKLIRVVWNKGIPDKDVVFLVEVSEVKKKTAERQVKSIFATSVVIHAKNGKPDVVAKRIGKDITITNEGNTSAKVSSISQCDGSDCADPGILFQIMPKQSIKFVLPFAKKLDYQIRYLNTVLNQSSN
jgi:P pilus assembly chaperone PapD